MRRGMLAAAVAVVAAMAAGSHALGGELVVNGGFETGSFFPWSAPPNVPMQSNFRIEAGGGHSGEFYAQLSSVPLQFMSQVLPTNAGSDYELSFWVRIPSIALGHVLGVRWEGQVAFEHFFTGLQPLPWTEFSVPLHSNINGSLLEFGQDVFPSEFHIDDISVVQVPAPGAAAVMVVGGAVAVVRRRRGITAEAREVAG